ncbi:MAG: hypothetical protein GJ676_14345 [Rhodobacteraceae bacterium]|nr:hypothetical protein [Paracoccaceae bacterium]
MVDPGSILSVKTLIEEGRTESVSAFRDWHHASKTIETCDLPKNSALELYFASCWAAILTFGARFVKVSEAPHCSHSTGLEVLPRSEHRFGCAERIFGAFPFLVSAAKASFEPTLTNAAIRKY